MPKPTRWIGSDEQIIELLKLYREGEPVRTLARKFKCRTDLISNTLRECGYAVYKGHGRTSPAKKAAIIFAYRNGTTTLKELSSEFDLSTDTISKMLRREGIKSDKWETWTQEKFARLREMHDGGAKLDELCEAFHIKRSALGTKLRRAGVPPREQGSGPGHHNWRGGRIVGPEGYVSVRPQGDDWEYCRPNSSGYVLEHRLVMGRALGRPVADNETVHHINGVRDDNRLENLQLRQGQHGSGVVMVCNCCGSQDVSVAEIASEVA